VREKVFLETVKIEAFLLAIEQVLITEEYLDLVLAEGNAILNDLGVEKDLLGNVTKTCKVETGVGNFSTSKHVPQLLSKFVTDCSAQQLLLNAKEWLNIE